MSLLAKVTRGKIATPHFVIIYGPDGVGKCFGKNTPIMMFDGSSKMSQDIEANDILMGPDSLPRTVLKTHSGVDSLFRVTQTKGDSFVCNSKHEIYVKDTKNGKCVVRCFEAAKWDTMTASDKHHLMLVRAPLKFAESPTSIDPYFLGVWLGDGTKNATSIQITNPDQEIFDYLESFAAQNDLTLKKRGISLSLTSYSRGETPKSSKIKHLLSEAIIENKKRIPRSYLINSEEVRMGVLAGLLDTDGHLIHNCFEISCKDQELAEDIIFLARSLGFQATCRLKKSTIKETGFSAYYSRIFISGHTHEIPTKIQRKKAGIRSQEKNPLHSGFKIEPIGEGEYFGWEVDSDHLFLLSDFTVVHNSSFAASAPNPIFLEPEQGSANLDVARFPGIKTFAEARAAVNELRTEKHDYKTLAIDSIDWLEPLVWAQVCVEGGGVKLIDEAYGGYGKGYTAATRLWAEFISELKALRQEKSMNVVLVAHSHVKTFNDPYQAQPYDRHQLKLNDKAAALWREAVDAVLFATYETFVTNPEKGKKAKAFGDGKRVLYTERRPSFDAKNRDGLPFEIPLSWQEYAAAVNKSEPNELVILKKDIEDRIAGETDANLKALMQKGYKDAGDNLQNLGIILNTIKARQGA